MTKKGRRKHHSCVLILNIEKQIFFAKSHFQLFTQNQHSFGGRKKENLSIDNSSHNRHLCHSE